MINLTILVGRVGKQAEVRKTPSGATVANFSVATSENWVDKQGVKQERTTWHRVVLWGNIAEFLGPKLKKGTLVYVEGPTGHREYQTKDGQTRWSTEVKAQKLKLVGNTIPRDLGRGGEGEEEPADAQEPPPGEPEQLGF